jgi:hypothetical protein
MMGGARGAGGGVGARGAEYEQCVLHERWWSHMKRSLSVRALFAALAHSLLGLACTPTTIVARVCAAQVTCCRTFQRTVSRKCTLLGNAARDPPTLRHRRRRRHRLLLLPLPRLLSLRRLVAVLTRQRLWQQQRYTSGVACSGWVLDCA